MKILLCLHHFLPEFIGGTEIYTLRLAQYLKQSGMEPVILIPNFDQSLTNEYAYEQIRVIRYAENSIEDRSMILGNKKPDGIKEFEEILILEKPNIIHFHELAPGRGFNIFHVEKAHDLYIPIVLTFHLSYYTCNKGSLIYKDAKKCDGVIRINRCTDCVYQEKSITGIKAMLLRNTALLLYKLNLNPTKLNNTIGTALGFPFVINKIKKDLFKLSDFASKIVVLSEWYKTILKKNGIPRSKLVYIKQGLAGMVKLPLYHHKVNMPIKIVFIGRISELKGVHLLIDAVNKLPQSKVSLYIFGPQKSDDYTDECRKKTLLKTNIHWKGTVASESVITIISKYDVLCLPSTFSEMSPLVIQEAFAAGLPVLASDVYGNAEQIQDGVNGWLFRFKDSNDLANKLKHLINDPGLIEKARLNLPAVNTFHEVAEKHMELYQTICNSKKQVS